VLISPVILNWVAVRPGDCYTITKAIYPVVFYYARLTKPDHRKKPLNPLISQNSFLPAPIFKTQLNILVYK